MTFSKNIIFAELDLSFSISFLSILPFSHSSIQLVWCGIRSETCHLSHSDNGAVYTSTFVLMYTHALVRKPVCHSKVADV